MSLKKKMKFFFTAAARDVLSGASLLVRVHKKRILFYSYSGAQYSCSPRYLSEYISRNYTGKYEIIWAFRDLQEIKGVPEGIVKVRYNSARFLYYYASSRFIVNNIFPYFLLKTKKNQFMIDTWHGGGAYKCAVTDQNLKADRFYRKELDFNSRNITVFLSSSKAFTDCFIRHDLHYKGNIMKSGLIRNDMMFADKAVASSITGKVKRKLGVPPDDKILLYAPTWRPPADKENGFVFDVERIRKVLSERFGGEWRIVFRMHRLTDAELLPGTADASQYPDMQELLLAANFMITDYSSCIWDYVLTRKPMLLYAYDLNEYIKKQGFYEDIHKWKLPVCETFDDVVQVIRNTTDAQFCEYADAHFKKLEGYDCGQAAKKAAEYILRCSE